MIKEKIREKLISLQDLKYRDFSSSLMPTVDKNTVIGVRIPLLRAYAKELLEKAYAENDFSDIYDFLYNVPHTYFEENNLHAFLVAGIKDFSECLRLTESFLPFIDNWATCDSFRPKCFAKGADKLLPFIEAWLESDKPYTVRYAIELLMTYFLDDRFLPRYPASVSKIRTNEYYVNMMIAWYFATALAKQYEFVLPYLEEHRLDAWVHNKAIQKAVESYRITSEQKAYLKTLKVK